LIAAVQDVLYAFALPENAATKESAGVAHSGHSTN
jgi:hypothetical protein